MISRVVYGGIISASEEQKDSDKYVEEAIDRGVNYFDVAPAYGDAQLKLGNSLRPYRNDVFLACKTAIRNEADARVQMKESLELLHTDHFDVFQLHAMTTAEDVEQAFAKDGVMNFLIEAKKDGIIRNLGFSAHSEDTALRLLELYDFDTILFPFNWATEMDKGMGDRLVMKAKEKNLGILALKAMAMRHWKEGEARDFPKCWYKPIDMNSKLALAALKYTLSLGVHTIVPPGHFEYLKFVLDNFDECIRNPLNQDDKDYLNHEMQNIQKELIF
ncbi:MAG: aldo/keto reductase [Saccharofermentanales bacterium]